MEAKAKKDPTNKFRRILLKPAPMKMIPTKHDLAKIPVLGTPASVPKHADSMTFEELQGEMDAME
jgi:hypothetical protein